MSTQSQRALGKSMLAAGVALAGSALLPGLGIPPLDTTGVLGTVQHDVALSAGEVAGAVGVLSDTTPLDTFQQALQFLLNNLIKINGTGVGMIPLADLADPDHDTTIQSLLAGGHLSVSSNLNTVFNVLGLDNPDLTVSNLLGEMNLPANATLDTLFTSASSPLHGLGSLTLDQMLGGLAIPGVHIDGASATSTVMVNSSTPLANLVDALDFGNLTLSRVMGMVGLPSGVTLDNVMTALGVGPLEGLLPAIGINPHQETLLDLTGLIGLHGSGTLDSLLYGNGMLASVGSTTLGTLLNFSSTTSLLNVIDEMQINGASLGSQTLESLLGSVHIAGGETLGQLLASLPISKTTTLGGETIQQILTGMLNPKDATGTVLSGTTPEVTDTSTLGDFLTGIGIGNMTLDHLLGLT